MDRRVEKVRTSSGPGRVIFREEYNYSLNGIWRGALNNQGMGLRIGRHGTSKKTGKGLDQSNCDLRYHCVCFK